MTTRNGEDNDIILHVRSTALVSNGLRYSLIRLYSLLD